MQGWLSEAHAMRWPQRALLVLAPVAILALAWSPAWQAPYQYDDTVTPLHDPASQSLPAWAEALPRTLRPLTKLSFATESSLGLTHAPERRVLSAGLLLLCVATLALLVRRAGLAIAPAAALATLWAVHPVHAETLIALAGRSALFALCLTLLSALCLLARRERAAWAFALLALLARETAFPWLVACAGVVAWQRGARPKRVFGVGLAAFALGAALVFASSRLRFLVLDSLRDPAALNRLGLQWAALPRGTAMLLLSPAGFTLDIDFAPTGFARLGYVVLAMAMFGVAVWLVLRARSTPFVRVTALLWLCLVVPLHSVVPKLDPLTARSPSCYSTALLLLAALGLAWVWPRRGVQLTFWVSVCVLGALWLSITRQRAELYRDPIRLWRDAAARSSISTRPLINLGTLLAQQGKLHEARAAFERAVQRDAHSREARERLRAVHVLLETRQLLMEPSTHESGQDSTLSP